MHWANVVDVFSVVSVSLNRLHFYLCLCVCRCLCLSLYLYLALFSSLTFVLTHSFLSLLFSCHSLHTGLSVAFSPSIYSLFLFLVRVRFSCAYNCWHITSSILLSFTNVVSCTGAWAHNKSLNHKFCVNPHWIISLFRKNMFTQEDVAVLNNFCSNLSSFREKWPAQRMKCHVRTKNFKTDHPLQTINKRRLKSISNLVSFLCLGKIVI